ncbi:hypothetical protein JCM33374_g4063 [Metschnikowia sp. JCM 33374]|nr:hypothetical protein JCM33374_g4063 [Metschnikowia sp. JCM 33374]
MEDLPTRWEVELEFVQSLANIQYVNFLAQNGYFSDPAFIAYLEYLNYWKEAKYAKYLVYPNCLHILTLLQKETFRKDIVNPDFMNTLMNDMVHKWQRQEEGAESEGNANGESGEPKNEAESNNTTEAEKAPVAGENSVLQRPGDPSS